MAALSDLVRRCMTIAFASPGAAKELADALDNVTTTGGTLAGPMVFSGTVALNGQVTLGDAVNIAAGTATGTQIGTGTTQKLGFFGATPVAQQAGSVDVLTSLVNVGLRAASANPPLNLGTGALTCGNVTAAGATIAIGSNASPAAAGTTNANGTALAAANNFVTAADGTKGVVLPAAPVVNQEVTVVNTVLASALKVYADAGGTGGTINGGAANAAASLAGGKAATYICISTTGANQWWSLSN